MIGKWISSVTKIWDFLLFIPLFLFNTEVINLNIISMSCFQESNYIISIVSVYGINSYSWKTTGNYKLSDICKIQIETFSLEPDLLLRYKLSNFSNRITSKSWLLRFDLMRFYNFFHFFSLFFLFLAIFILCFLHVQLH